MRKNAKKDETVETKDAIVEEDILVTEERISLASFKSYPSASAKCCKHMGYCPSCQTINLSDKYGRFSCTRCGEAF